MQDAFCLLPDTCVGEFGVGIEKDVGRLAVKAHDQAGIAAFGEDLLVDALPVDVGRAQAGVVGTDADLAGPRRVMVICTPLRELPFESAMTSPE